MKLLIKILCGLAILFWIFIIACGPVHAQINYSCYSILTTHPRIYLTSDMFGRLTTQASLNSYEWQKLKLSANTDTTGQDGTGSKSSALIWNIEKRIPSLTSNASTYGISAIKNVTNIIRNQTAPTSENVIGRYCEEIGCVLDWTWDLSTFAEKTMMIYYLTPTADVGINKSFSGFYNGMFKNLQGIPTWAYAINGSRIDVTGTVTWANPTTLADSSKTWATVTGSVTSNGASLLVDSTKAWTTNQYLGYVIYIETGTGAGQSRQIYANTNKQLSVFPEWTTAPAAGSRYRITQWGWSEVRIVSGTGSGQRRRILWSTNTVLGLDSVWTVTPNGTSIYEIDRSPFYLESANNRILGSIAGLYQDITLGGSFSGYGNGGQYATGAEGYLLNYLMCRYSATSESPATVIPGIEKILYNIIYATWDSSNIATMQMQTLDHNQYPQRGGTWLSGLMSAGYPLYYLYRDNPSGKYLSWILTNLPHFKTASVGNAVYAFIWTDPSITAVNPSSLPLSYFGNGTTAGKGDFYARSDWGIYPTTFLNFICGDNWSTGQDHMDANHWALYSHGGHLLIDAGKYNGSSDWDGAEGRSIMHNTLTVYDSQENGYFATPGYAYESRKPNDGGQRTPLASKNTTAQDPTGIRFKQGVINHQEEKGTYSFIEGDATFAYANPDWSNQYNTTNLNSVQFRSKLNLFTRDLFYSHGSSEYIVIFDRVSTTRADSPKKIHWHFINEPTVSGTSTQVTPGHVVDFDGSLITATHRTGKVFIKTLLPSTFVTEKIGGDETNRASTSLLTTVGQVTVSNSSGGELGAGRIAWYYDTGTIARHGINVFCSKATSTMLITSTTMVLRTNGVITATFTFASTAYNTLEKIEAAIDAVSGWSGNFRAGFRWLIDGNNYPNGLTNEAEAGNWRTEIAAPTTRRGDYFLSVIHPDDTSVQGMAAASLVYSTQSSFIGTLIKDSSLNKVILFAENTAAFAGIITYTIDPITTCRHHIIGVVPNQKYSLSTSVVGSNQTFTLTTATLGTYQASSAGIVTFDSAGIIDSKAPDISAIAKSSTNNSAIITWTTSELANSQVNYGLTGSYGLSVYDGNFVTSHSISLSSLNSGTTYHFQIVTIDPSGNSTTTSDLTFGTFQAPDTTAPVISTISVGVSLSAATIAWVTDEASDSLLSYGTTNAYGDSSYDGSYVTTHQLIITGLQSATTYYYQLTSKDTAMNSISSTRTFSTNTPAIVYPLRISGVSYSASFVVSWSTDSPATSTVEYGLSSNNYDSLAGDSVTLSTGHQVTVTGVKPYVAYYFRALSIDSLGNNVESNEYVITLGVNTVAPVISVVNSLNADTGNVTITWTTDKDSASLVEWGIWTTFNNSTTFDNEDGVVSHLGILSGLEPYLLYAYRVTSIDAFGNQSVSSTKLFYSSNPIGAIDAVLARYSY